MKHLYQVVESILDPDFDITDDDINPVKMFVDKYKSTIKREYHYFIENKWNVREMDKLIRHYGKYEGTIQNVVTSKFLKDAHSKNNPIVIVAKFKYRADFFIVVPTPGQNWDFYTCDPGYYDVSLFQPLENTMEELKRCYLFAEPDLPFRLYKLKDDQFLKDLQKYLAG